MGQAAAKLPTTSGSAFLGVERSLTGRLNWADFMNAVPPERWREAADGIYQIQAIDLSDFRISYVEHIPGQSGGGVIQTSQARVNIDQIEGTIVDLIRPEAIDAWRRALKPHLDLHWFCIGKTFVLKARHPHLQCKATLEETST